MPCRMFMDSAGTEWHVWDIVPRHTERRRSKHRDRRMEKRGIQFPERRSESRRLGDTRRAVIRGTYSQGWLCFESHLEKRRVCPIPPGWTAWGDELLEQYLWRGEPVAGIQPLMAGFSNDDRIAEAG